MAARNIVSLTRIAGGLVKAHGLDFVGNARTAAAIYDALATKVDPADMEAACRIAADCVLLGSADVQAVVKFTVELLSQIKPLVGEAKAAVQAARSKAKKAS